MGIAYNPKTVTNGLVLFLDAANPKSYPGSGTMWSDLTGNGYNATLQNNPTFNSLGYISFDGINQHATFSSPSTFSTGNGTNYSFEVWFKMRTLPTAEYGANGHIWGGENGNNVVMYLNPASGGSSRGIMVYDDSRYNTGHMTSGGFLANEWNQWVIIGNGTTNTITHFINGNLDRLNGPVLGGQEIKSWTGIRIAHDARWNTYSELDLASIKQYNRILTDAEIQQNFQAIRGRFNI
jgi:hypothetical protein